MDLSCHPRIDKQGGQRPRRQKQPACFDPASLGKIQGKFGGDGSHKTPEAKWEFITEAMNRDCGRDQTCIAKTASQKINVPAEEFFRPFAPKKWRRTKPWLSTSQIAAVMTQQEDAYPDFLFVGPTPIDWYLKEGTRCLVSELCSAKYTELRKKYRWLGVVFNLDSHTEAGSHWVAAMIDLRGPGFYYQDSQGQPPEREIRELQCMFGNQMTARQRGKQELQWNSHRHQQKNTECGMQSILFLERMLKGESFAEICTTMPGDDAVVALRSQQFNF